MRKWKRICAMAMAVIMVCGGIFRALPIAAQEDAGQEKGVIADFKLDGTEEGYKGAGAKATVHAKDGTDTEFPYEEAEGKSGLRFNQDRWLEVAKEDGTPLLKGLDEFTISYDSYTASANSSSNYIFFLTNTHEDGKATAANAAAYPRFGVLDYSGTLRILNGLDGFNGSAASGWKHIDVVYTAESVTVYVDGVQASTKASYEGIARILGSDESYIWIGKGPFTPVNSQLFDGYLSNLKIYNYARTAQELQPEEDEKVTSIEVSATGNASVVRMGTGLQMSAVVKNQFGVEMDGEKVTWAVSGEDGVTVSEDGLLSVPEDAVAGSKITLTATSVTNSEIKGTKELLVIVKKTEQKRELIADFKLDGTEDGYKGAGAKATVHAKDGTDTEFPYEEAEGKSGLRFNQDRWLEVAKEDGTPLLKGLDEFTISYDSYTASANSSSNYIFFLTNTHEDGKATAANAAAYPRFGVLDYSGTLRILNGLDGFNGSAASGWKHIDVVYTAESVTVYVDGVQASTKASYEGIARILGSDESYIWIGKGPFAPVNSQLFDGFISDFKIYDYALTAEELVPKHEVSSIEVSGADNATVVKQGAALQMSAVVKDQYGDIMAEEGVTWTVNRDNGATISADGLLSVAEDTAAGSKITVTAISATKPEVTGTKVITVIAKDKQDSNGNIGAGNNVTDNNVNGNKVNGSVGNKVDQNSRKSLKKATITVKKGKKKVSKVTVKKGKKVTLKVSVNSKAKISMKKLKKKQKKIAKITLKKGKLTIKAKKKGKISITLTSVKTAKYKNAVKKIKITVKK